MVEEAVDWTWSSHRAMLGKVAPPPFLDVEWTLGQFARKLDVARQAYADFIAAGRRAIEEARLEERGQTPGPGPPGRGRYD
jgi:hypothetical protein